MSTSPPRRRSAWLRVIFAVTIVLLLIPNGSSPSAQGRFGPYTEDELEPDRMSPHGALGMDAQIEMFYTLLPDLDVTKPPAGVDPFIWNHLVPADNQMTPERVELGRKLYFDTRLGKDDTVSCATCHDVSRGFTDQRPTSEGFENQLGQRNAPTSMNAMFYEELFLDGRVPSLEEQAGLPPINPIEGGFGEKAEVTAAIAHDPDYIRMFREAYGSEPNYDDMIRAIAAFERTLVFLQSPFDRYLAGSQDAISESAKRGWVLYNGKGRCMSCHMLNPTSPVGTDNRYHNVGVSARKQNFEDLARRALATLAESDSVEAIDKLALETEMSELGRFLVTKDRADIGAFRTQAVRNVALTAPYMHDGSMRTLWDVMDHYNKGGEPNPFLDGGIEPLGLTENEIDDLVALMFAMTDERFAEQSQAELEMQRAIARKERPFRDEAMAFGRVLPFEKRVMESTDRTGGSEQ